jgi:acetolactate synthase-1/2/3 large subunit
MAFGYARASGKVGAYAVVPGPGLLNTTAALSTAYATNAPVLCISGQVPSDLIGRGFGLLHEIPDQLGILQTLTKWAARIDHPTQTGRLVNEAFRQLRDGRPRPVGLEMPLDVMALETEVALPEAEGRPPATAPDPELIEKAAGLLAEAKKPMLFVGGGAVDAAEEVLAIAEMLEAPVVSYTGGKGIVSDRHYLAQSAFAGHELWREADVVLAVGTRLHQPQVRWGVDRDLQLIRIDIDPTEITRILKPALGIVAHAKPALAAPWALNGAVSRQSAASFRRRRPVPRQIGNILQSNICKRSALSCPTGDLAFKDLTQVGYVGRVAFSRSITRAP